MTTLRVWAPEAERVAAVVAGGPVPLRREPGGWWAAEVAGLRPGDDYAFTVDDGPPLPDPRSRRQPAGVHGPSRVVDPSAPPWTDHGWRGRPLAGAVVYELHVGTFTPAGTFDAAVEHLDHLVDLGVDFVELLPVAAFPGRHGWGYDGVDLYAVHEPYGGPAGLARFVDAAHARGLGVLLDVVYNHLGPDGNYLGRFGPYFTDRHHTPWGPAVNVDDAGSDEVRRFVIDNALAWLVDYHLDGLRLDAVHAIVDTSATHLLEELADAVRVASGRVGRTLVLVAESDLNDPRVITPPPVGYGLQAQWSDDFHHALHAALTGERDGYYADFGGLAPLARALRRGYVYTGAHSSVRGRRHGRPLLTGTPGHRLLGYLQNHDQVGNRARGERSAMLLSPGRLRIGAALVLTSPFTPLLFMGEEWGATTPWQYFTDHADPALAEAVRTGRRAEFAAFGWEPAEVPDPQDPATMARSRLDWSQPTRSPHAEILDLYRRLIRLRRAHPELADPDLSDVRVDVDDAAGWLVVHRGGLRVAANLGPTRRTVPLDGDVAEVLLDTGGAGPLPRGLQLAAESVAVVRLG